MKGQILSFQSLGEYSDCEYANATDNQLNEAHNNYVDDIHLVNGMMEGFFGQVQLDVSNYTIHH